MAWVEVLLKISRPGGYVYLKLKCMLSADLFDFVEWCKVICLSQFSQHIYNFSSKYISEDFIAVNNGLGIKHRKILVFRLVSSCFKII